MAERKQRKVSSKKAIQHTKKRQGEFHRLTASSYSVLQHTTAAHQVFTRHQAGVVESERLAPLYRNPHRLTQPRLRFFLRHPDHARLSIEIPNRRGTSARDYISAHTHIPLCSIRSDRPAGVMETR